MAPKYAEGQEIRYKVGGNESTGTIQSIMTQPGRQGARKVNASPDNPHYKIKNSNTGKTSSIAEGSIVGKA